MNNDIHDKNLAQAIALSLENVHKVTIDDYKNEDVGIRSIFVYGSLRPDDNSNMSWTKQACDGMNYYKSIVKDHCLYFDKYACVKSNKPGKQVIGYILTPDPKRKDVNWFEKLKYYDWVEKYNLLNKSNNLYNREITEAINMTTKEKVSCYIYIKNNCSENNEILEGDWLKR